MSFKSKLRAHRGRTPRRRARPNPSRGGAGFTFYDEPRLSQSQKQAIHRKLAEIGKSLEPHGAGPDDIHWVIDGDEIVVGQWNHMIALPVAYAKSTDGGKTWEMGGGVRNPSEPYSIEPVDGGWVVSVGGTIIGSIEPDVDRDGWFVPIVTDGKFQFLAHTPTLPGAAQNIFTAWTVAS